MAIRDEQGNVYRLTSPNPIRRRQNQWNKTSLVLHNFTWQGLTLPDESTSQPFSSDIEELNISTIEEIAPPKKEYIPEIKVEPEKDIEEEISIAIQEVEKEIEETSPYNQETQKFLDENKIMMWCSPPVITETIDHLYGENQRTIDYTTKYSFEGVIISQNDLEMSFWTPIDITRNSIIFPVDLKKRRSRWWRVIETEKKDGTVARCTLSEHSLDFSD